MGKLLSTMIAITSLVLASSSMPAKAETTECTEITSLPAVITVQGVYCFKQNLTTAITSGKAIDIQANNVTIDLNSWKLGGSTAGPTTGAYGIFAGNRKNITIRNGTIRGFSRGIYLEGSLAGHSGHLVEEIRADGNGRVGLEVEGNNVIVRNNQVTNTGFSTNSFVTGISVAGNNVVVSGNIVSEVTGTSNSTGVYILGNGATLSKVEISGNSVMGMNTATDRHGIRLFDAANVVVKNNRIINSAGGTAVIFEETASTDIDCIENVTRGYTTAFTACDYTSGNHSN